MASPEKVVEGTAGIAGSAITITPVGAQSSDALDTVVFNSTAAPGDFWVIGKRYEITVRRK